MAEGLETDLECSDRTKQDTNNNTSLKPPTVADHLNYLNNNQKPNSYLHQKMLGAIMPCEKICSGFGAIKKEIETSITNTTTASSSTSSSPNLINVKSCNSINNLINSMSSPRENLVGAGQNLNQEQHGVCLKDEVSFFLLL
jgi:hypothetical protein